MCSLNCWKVLFIVLTYIHRGYPQLELPDDDVLNQENHIESQPGSQRDGPWYYKTGNTSFRVNIPPEDLAAAKEYLQQNEYDTEITNTSQTDTEEPYTSTTELEYEPIITISRLILKPTRSQHGVMPTRSKPFANPTRSQNQYTKMLDLIPTHSKLIHQPTRSQHTNNNTIPTRSNINYKPTRNHSTDNNIIPTRSKPVRLQKLFANKLELIPTRSKPISTLTANDKTTTSLYDYSEISSIVYEYVDSTTNSPYRSDETTKGITRNNKHSATSKRTSFTSDKVGTSTLYYDYSEIEKRTPYGSYQTPTFLYEYEETNISTLYGFDKTASSTPYKTETKPVYKPTRSKHIDNDISPKTTTDDYFETTTLKITPLHYEDDSINFISHNDATARLKGATIMTTENYDTITSTSDREDEITNKGTSFEEKLSTYLYIEDKSTTESKTTVKDSSMVQFKRIKVLDLTPTKSTKETTEYYDYETFPLLTSFKPTLTPKQMRSPTRTKVTRSETNKLKLTASPTRTGGRPKIPTRSSVSKLFTKNMDILSTLTSKFPPTRTNSNFAKFLTPSSAQTKDDALRADNKLYFLKHETKPTISFPFKKPYKYSTTKPQKFETNPYQILTKYEETTEKNLNQPSDITEMKPTVSFPSKMPHIYSNAFSIADKTQTFKTDTYPVLTKHEETTEKDSNQPSVKTEIKPTVSFLIKKPHKYSNDFNIADKTQKFETDTYPVLTKYEETTETYIYQTSDVTIKTSSNAESKTTSDDEYTWISEEKITPVYRESLSTYPDFLITHSDDYITGNNFTNIEYVHDADYKSSTQEYEDYLTPLLYTIMPLTMDLLGTKSITSDTTEADLYKYSVLTTTPHSQIELVNDKERDKQQEKQQLNIPRSQQKHMLKSQQTQMQTTIMKTNVTEPVIVKKKTKPGKRINKGKKKAKDYKSHQQKLVDALRAAERSEWEYDTSTTTITTTPKDIYVDYVSTTTVLTVSLPECKLPTPTITTTTTGTTPTTTVTTTKRIPLFDLKELMSLIANLTFDYETNITHHINESLQKYSIPTCRTFAPPTTVSLTPSTSSTTVPPYYPGPASGLAIIISKCFVCGLDEPGIPYDANCADAFAGDFLPLVPVDPTARGKLSKFRKYCRFKDIPGVYQNSSDPRSVFGRWTGGCAVRWNDISGVYTQRTCRNRYRAIVGKHFASKRMAKLEMALSGVDNGCIASPSASLIPLSRGISLFAKFHACVCSGNWCNTTTRIRHNAMLLYTLFIFINAVR